MELSFKLSEAQYLRAWRLRNKASSLSDKQLIALSCFVAVCLILATMVLARWWERTAPVSASHSSSAFLAMNGLPLLVIIGFWIFLATGFGTLHTRRLYRNDPSLHVDFKASISPVSMSFESTAGVSLKTSWSVYESWREGKDVVILILRSGTYLILGLSGLTEAERQELRRILHLALPDAPPIHRASILRTD